MINTDYIVIQAPMVTELGLSGNRLLIYALIHGFSKDGVHEFRGSINYICEWTNLTRNTVISVLKSLVDDGLITKREYIENNVKFCAYQIRGSAKITPLVQKLHYPSAKISPNNNINNNIECNIECNTLFSDINSNDNKEKENSQKEKDFELFEQCWLAYRRKGRKNKSKDQWLKLSKDEKKIVLPHIKAYTSSREIRFQQDFERYLQGKTFNSIVFANNGSIIYDPTIQTTNEYIPHGYGIFYDDNYKCYCSMNADDVHIFDGYTDDDRPNGARLMLNNARGILVWDGETKKWIKK